MSKRREYRPPYPAAFRRDAVALVQSSGRPIREIASERGVSPAVVALAWLLARRDFVVPIPGTKRVQYVEDNAQAVEVALTPDELQRLEAIPDARGDRYSSGAAPGWVSPPLEPL